MKERPILFSAPMVRVVLKGSKTQTRRVWKLPRDCSWYAGHGGEAAGMVQDDDGPAWWHVSEQRCPYGQPGDRLWVREAWRVGRKHDGTKPSDLLPRSMTVEYEAGGYACNSPWSAGEWHSSDCAPREHPEWVGKLRPPIHMPRWASRITLEITGVRVERLQDISQEDALAEGCAGGHGSIPGYGYNATPCEQYRALWESLHGPGAWDANPWVWVVQFRRVDAVKERA